MTSPMPTSITVGSITYDVICDRQAFLEMKDREGCAGGIYGHSSHTEAVIHINPDHTACVQRLSLMHECLHALCNAAMGDPSWKGLGKTASEREEKVVRMFEAPLLNLLRDNPDLVAYLTDDGGGR